MAKNSEVRKVRVTASGLSIGHMERLTQPARVRGVSRAGLAEMGVEKSLKRQFGESNEDFQQRVLAEQARQRLVHEND